MVHLKGNKKASCNIAVKVMASPANAVLKMQNIQEFLI